MPKLPAPMAEQAAKASEEGGRFEALEPGVYVGRLAKVEATTSKQKEGGGGGNPMWKLEFDEIHDLDGNRKPGRQFTNLTLIDTAMWKVGLFFDAFGVPHNTDTDELIGQRVRLSVTKRPITTGARAGTEGNDVQSFIHLKDGDTGYDDLVRLQNKLNKGAKPRTESKSVKAEEKASETASTAAAEAGDGGGGDADF